MIPDDLVEKARIGFAREAMKLERDVLLFGLTCDEERNLIRAALEAAGVLLKERETLLPCDVKLPPATVIRAGCKLGTLLEAIECRRGFKQ